MLDPVMPLSCAAGLATVPWSLVEPKGMHAGDGVDDVTDDVDEDAVADGVDDDAVTDGVVTFAVVPVEPVELADPPPVHAASIRPITMGAAALPTRILIPQR
jgi:hypothetical protein